MLNENEFLDYYNFNLRIATLEDGSKEIIIAASKSKDDPLFTKAIRISESELKYFKFEHSRVLDYALSGFLFNLSKAKNDID